MLHSKYTVRCRANAQHVQVKYTTSCRANTQHVQLRLLQLVHGMQMTRYATHSVFFLFSTRNTPWTKQIHVGKQQPCFLSHCSKWNGDVAQLVESRGRRTTDAGWTRRWGKGFPSQRKLSVQTLLRCSYSSRMQSHAVTSVSALTLPLFERRKTQHTKSAKTE